MTKFLLGPFSRGWRGRISNMRGSFGYLIDKRKLVAKQQDLG